MRAFTPYILLFVAPCIVAYLANLRLWSPYLSQFRGLDRPLPPATPIEQIRELFTLFCFVFLAALTADIHPSIATIASVFAMVGYVICVLIGVRVISLASFWTCFDDWDSRHYATFFATFSGGLLATCVWAFGTIGWLQHLSTKV